MARCQVLARSSPIFSLKKAGDVYRILKKRLHAIEWVCSSVENSTDLDVPSNDGSYRSKVFGSVGFIPPTMGTHGFPSFLGIITHILGVQNLHFSWFWGPREYTPFIRISICYVKRKFRLSTLVLFEGQGYEIKSKDSVISVYGNVSIKLKLLATLEKGIAKYITTLRIMQSQNWWFGDPRTLL